MVSEEQLGKWTGPSSDTEQDKQSRAERMIRQAIDAHEAFNGYKFDVYAKGSYANNTNVKADSDVDIVVQCREVSYWDEAKPAEGGHPPSASYKGIWTPAKLRSEVKAALEAKFPGAVVPGSTAFQITPSSARVPADVVPSFTYKYYFPSGNYREGTKVFKSDGSSIVNYPQLQLENGRAKNNRTNGFYKKSVRILKRLENVLVSKGLAEEQASYLLECLVYNCPDEYFLRDTWRGVMRECLADIYNYTLAEEPTANAERWYEVNGAKYLFHSSQKWTRQEVHQFARAAWDHMGFD